MKRFKTFVTENNAGIPNSPPMPKRTNFPAGAEGDKAHSDALRSWANREKSLANIQTTAANIRATGADWLSKGLSAVKTGLDWAVDAAGYVIPQARAIGLARKSIEGLGNLAAGNTEKAKELGVDAVSTFAGQTVGLKTGGLFGKGMGGQIASGLIGSEVTDRVKNKLSSMFGAKSSTQNTSSPSSTSTNTTPSTSNLSIDSSTAQPIEATTSGTIKLSSLAKNYQTSGPASSGRNQSLKPQGKVVTETWQEYNWKFGEDRKRSKQVLKMLRKHFKLPENMPGDE